MCQEVLMISIFPFAVAIDRRSNAVVINADSSPINPETPAITDRITLISVGADRALTLGDSKVDRVVLSLNHRPGELPDWVWSDDDVIAPSYAFVPFARAVSELIFRPGEIIAQYGPAGVTIAKAMIRKLTAANTSVRDFEQLVVVPIGYGHEPINVVADIDNRIIVDAVSVAPYGSRISVCELSNRIGRPICFFSPSQKRLAENCERAPVVSDEPTLIKCESLIRTLKKEFHSDGLLLKYLRAIRFTEDFSTIVKYI